MSRLAINYASRLAGAYLLSIAAAVAIVIPLGGEALTGAQNYFTTRNIIGSAVLVAVGTLVVAVGGLLNIAPTLSWFIPGLEPDDRQRRGVDETAHSPVRTSCRHVGGQRRTVHPATTSTAGSASSCRPL